jgi:hypothetical protein
MKVKSMRVVGSLRLPEADVARYQKALEAYDIERSSEFLRLCAHTLIKHAEAGDILECPWSLRTIRPAANDSTPTKSLRALGKVAPAKRPRNS